MPRGSPLWRLSIDTKKRESSTVARSACRGLRIAHHCRTSKQRRSLTQNMCKYANRDAHAPAADGIYIPTRHLLFATFLTVIESCEVSTSQERASSKRFPYMSIRTRLFASLIHPAPRYPGSWVGPEEPLSAGVVCFAVCDGKVMNYLSFMQ